MLDNQKLGKRLVSANIISQAQLDDALRQQQIQEGRLGEILVRLAYVTESTVLQFLAAEFRTRYVSTERLAKAKIPQTVLDSIPVHLAERYNLIPVLYDPDTSTLSIVTSDPQNESALREVHMLTRVRELRVYVALQSAVQAAIRKHYRGEVDAFNQILQNQSSAYQSSTYKAQPEQQPALQENYSTHYEEDSSDATMFSPAASLYANNSAYSNQQNIYGTPQNYNNSTGNFNAAGSTFDPNAAAAANPYAYRDPNSPYIGNTQNPSSFDYDNQHYAYDGDDDDEPTKLYDVGAFTDNPFQNASQSKNESLVDSTSSFLQPVSPFGNVQLLELVRVMVERLEGQHPLYKNHLASQRQLLRMLLKALQITPPESEIITMAFLLHHVDLPDPHPCLLSLARDDAFAKNVQQAHQKYLQSLAYVQFSPQLLEIIQHLYERYDGKGFPGERIGENIPLGSRIIAILDTYVNLLNEDPDVEADEIIERLENHAGKLFDPEILTVFSSELHRLENYQKGDMISILLLHHDKNQTADMERELLKEGYWVEVAHELSEGHQLCQDKQFDLIALGVSFPSGASAFDFVAQLKEDNKLSAPEFLFFAQEAAPEVIQQGMTLGRDFFAGLPLSILNMKIKKHLEQIKVDKERKAAVLKQKSDLDGSLEQLSLPDLLQVLSQGRRSGELFIQHTNSESGSIYLDSGQVVNAICGPLKAEKAFYKMIAWEKGKFSLRSDFKCKEHLINAPLDGLILDALRILDEERHEGGKKSSGGQEDDFFDLDFGEDSSDDENTEQEDIFGDFDDL